MLLFCYRQSIIYCLSSHLIKYSCVLYNLRNFHAVFSLCSVWNLKIWQPMINYIWRYFFVVIAVCLKKIIRSLSFLGKRCVSCVLKIGIVLCSLTSMFISVLFCPFCLILYVCNFLPTTFTFTFMHLADAFIQSDLQLHSGYTFLLVHVFPGNRTHNLSLSWRNVLPLSHTGTFAIQTWMIWREGYAFAFIISWLMDSKIIHIYRRRDLNSEPWLQVLTFPT